MSDQPTELIEEPTSSRSNLPVLLGVLGGIVALALVYLFVVQPLLSGDDDATVDPAPTAAAPAPPVTVSTEGDEPELLPAVTYEVFLSRDPFDPVVPEPTPVVAAPTADPATTDGTADGTTDGATDTATDGGAGGGTDGGSDDGTDAGGDPPPASTSDGCRGTDQVVCDGRMVSLIDVGRDDDGGQVAIVQVDTTVYEVARGDTFAGAFQVRSIDGSCVGILYGDDGFQLCKGDRVLK